MFFDRRYIKEKNNVKVCYARISLIGQKGDLEIQ